MSRKLTISLLAIGAAVAAQASPTVTWNSAQWTSGSVTYSGTASGVDAGGESAALAFNKFNSEGAATQLGQAGTYTLTSVVLSIDGSIAGTFSYQNTQANAGKVYASGLNNSTTRFVLSANSKSASEYYSYTVVADGDTPISVAGNTTVTRNLPNTTAPGVAATTINSDLATFIGYDTYSGSAYLRASQSTDSDAGISSMVTASGSANFSVTYYFNYTPVPEPNTLALLGFGGIAMLIRRRPRR